MDSSATTSAPTATDKAASSPLPGASTTDNTDNSSRDGNNLEFDPSLSEEERRFYLKAYPSVDLVRERKVHCTICKIHIGTAPAQESVIKMHPILRVTHCTKCHDFYNSGEFSKGEDGSELYCRWCGQGGEVYCCSNCPYVFCKSCIVKNLSRGVVADIEQNENWSCFSCAPKILWPLRAQHWALINYIDKQKKSIKTMNLSDSEERTLTAQDRSTCCRLAKAKCGNMSDSLESLDSAASKRSIGSINVASGKKTFQKQSPVPGHSPVAKRVKTSNDEVVCTPDLLSMLEPDCQITVSQKPRPVQAPLNSTPKVLSIQSSYGAQQTPKSSLPPPLVLRNTGIQMRPVTPGSIVRRTVIGPRTPTPGSTTTPVYHTINGYRIDLNSAAQQETFRLPNGKLIQVKRQGAQQQQLQQHQLSNINSWQQRTPATIQQHARPVQITQASPQSQYQTITIQPNSNNSHQMSHSQQSPMVRYHNTMVGSTTVTSVGHNGPQIQVLNGTPPAPVQNAAPTTTATVRPVMVRHVFPDNPIGQARSQLQEQVFNAMEICQHLTGKVQTLTNSNAYKQARNYLEVKELYIHLSYLLTYAIGRFKGLQDKCLGDMRLLGFVNDADSLENGQLAADKQASDDEDNEIEIVEPKTDTITLDSDNDDEEPTPDIKSSVATIEVQTPNKAIHSAVSSSSASAVSTTSNTLTVNKTSDTSLDMAMMSTSFLLASLLEVDPNDGDPNAAQSSPSGTDGAQKKQPRKKTTNKPNPTLIKQKEMLERERLEEMKRSDLKLKMKCAIELKKAEEEYPFAKQMLEEKKQCKTDEKNNENEMDIAENETRVIEDDTNNSKIIEEKLMQNKSEMIELKENEQANAEKLDENISETQDSEKVETDEKQCAERKETSVEIKQVTENETTKEVEVVVEISEENIKDAEDIRPPITTTEEITKTNKIESVESESMQPMEKSEIEEDDVEMIEPIEQDEETEVDKSKTELEKITEDDVEMINDDTDEHGEQKNKDTDNNDRKIEIHETVNNLNIKHTVDLADIQNGADSESNANRNDEITTEKMEKTLHNFADINAITAEKTVSVTIDATGHSKTIDTTAENTVVPSASPDLFNDINELIASENIAT